MIRKYFRLYSQGRIYPQLLFSIMTPDQSMMSFRQSYVWYDSYMEIPIGMELFKKN